MRIRTLIAACIVVCLAFALPAAEATESSVIHKDFVVIHEGQVKNCSFTITLPSGWKVDAATSTDTSEIALVNIETKAQMHLTLSDQGSPVTLAILWGAYLSGEGYSTTVLIDEVEEDVGISYAAVMAEGEDSLHLTTFKTTKSWHGKIFSLFYYQPIGVDMRQEIKTMINKAILK